MDRYLAVWNGEAEVRDLDALVTPAYCGHLGSRERDLAELKADIGAYRAKHPGVRFSIEHRFAAGDEVAMRVRADAVDASGLPLRAVGLNLSRWDGDRLAEEWAVWEQLA